MTASDQARPAIVAPRVRDLDELAATLTNWLRARLSTSGEVVNLRLRDFEYPRGAGQSHETILFEAEWARDGRPQNRGLVVRIKPTSFTVFNEDMFVQQYEVMRLLHTDGRVPVAEVLWLEEDPAILGAPFFVMERLAGRVAVSNPNYLETGWVADASPAQRARAWEQALRAMAALQTLPTETFEFLAPDDHQSGFDHEWSRWTRFLDHIDRPDRPLDPLRRAWTMLRDARPVNPLPGFSWGDARMGNMLVDENFDVVALMDWEQPSLGGAVQDLGWWLAIERILTLRNGGHSLPGIPDRDQSAATWADVTGYDPRDLDWHESFAALKIAALGVNMMDIRGLVPTGGDYTNTPMRRALDDSMRLWVS